MNPWLANIIPFVSNNEQAKILKETVALIEAQRDDAKEKLKEANLKVEQRDA